MVTAVPEDFGMRRCLYVMAYIGRCSAIQFDEYCETHREQKCCVCGDQATHECAHAGQFVCGYPLCDHAKGVMVKTPYGSGHKHTCNRPSVAVAADFGLES